MGCHSSKVSVTAEEIVARRREVKHVTTWWESLKRARSRKVAPHPTPEKTGSAELHDPQRYPVRRQSSLEVELLASNDSLHEAQRGKKQGTVAGAGENPVNGRPVNNVGTFRPSSNQTKRVQVEDDLTLEDIEDDFSRAEFWDSPPGSEIDLKKKEKPSTDIPSGQVTPEVPPANFTGDQQGFKKTVIENDLYLADFEDNGDPSRPSTATCTSTANVPATETRNLRDGQGPPLPTVTKTAWSDLYVPAVKGALPDVFKLRRRRARNVAHSSQDVTKQKGSKSKPVKRSRPMGAKGVRRPPDLTEVYDVELPGVSLENPKRREEDSCLNSWMTRRMDEEKK